MDEHTAETNAPTAREVLLAQVMADLAAGDGAALFTLREVFRPELTRAVRSVASTRGARLSADDVDELITEVALVLATLAGSWNPEFRVPPWVWARHRVMGVVDNHVGQWTRPLELVDQGVLEQADPAASSSEEPWVVEVVEQVAAEHPGVALLWDAVQRVASERDRMVFFEVLVQHSLGDRSAAVTVGAMVGLSPEAVRQQVGRIRRRIRELAANEPRFAELADLAIVA